MSSAHGKVADSMRDWTGTHAEKAAARRAFDLALERELEVVIREAKEWAARITEAAGLWEFEAWLGDQRGCIDRDFDYHYSVLPLAFANPFCSGRLTEDAPHGLAPDKLDVIRCLARYRSVA